MTGEPIEIHTRQVKGRGAVSNASGRYECQQYVATEDDWPGDGEDELNSDLRTRVAPDRSRSVIAKNQSPDVPFDRSINPYRGCEHGCIYCFARPGHAWLGLSPGLDFETKLFAKHDAPDLLRNELSRKGYKPRIIALGTATDPYQPIDRRLKITRQILEVLAEASHPVSIVTKSNLVLRDAYILSEMAKRNLAKVYLSVTSLDRNLSRIMEPRAPTPLRRLEAIEGLAAKGIPVGVLNAPLIPAINDAEIEELLKAAASAGAKSVSYVLLRLPLEIKDLFEEWLEAHFPDRKNRVLNLIRETRGGALYDAKWGKRMKGEGHYAKLIADRFRLANKRYGLGARDWDLSIEHFQAPGRDENQLSLF